MAGHRRTAPAWGTEASGRARRAALPAAEHRPPARTRRAANAAVLARSRLESAADSRARLAVAIGYVRSAAAKAARDAELDHAATALLRIGDRLMTGGKP